MEMGAGEGARLRPAVPADAKALACLNRRARAAAMPWLREVRSEAEVAAWIAGTLITRHEVWLAALPDPVGYIAFHASAGQGLTVLDLYIDPAWQRAGIGGELLALATRRGEAVSLRCFARNRAARAFYERQGFRAVAFGDGTGNEEGEPDVLYERKG